MRALPRTRSPSKRRVSVFDKFVPAGETPSLPRRALNPLARLLFSDLTRSLEPMLADTGLTLGPQRPRREDPEKRHPERERT